MFKWNLLYFILCLLCLVLSLRTTGKSFVQSFLFSPIRYLSTWIRSPWAFFASGRTVPAHSASPLIKDVSVPSSSLWRFSGLYLSMSVSFWDTKCQIQHSRCVSLVLSRGGGSPPSVCWWSSAWCSPGGCWPLFQRDMVGSWSACPPGAPGLQSCFSDSHSAICTGVWGYSSPGAGLDVFICWHFSLLNCMRFLLAHLLAILLRFLWMALQAFGVSFTPPRFATSTNLLTVPPVLSAGLCGTVHNPLGLAIQAVLNAPNAPKFWSQHLWKSCAKFLTVAQAFPLPPPYMMASKSRRRFVWFLSGIFQCHARNFL